MAVTLGKDCSISGVGSNAVVRSVTISTSAKEIECHPFGTRTVYAHAVGHSTTIDVEMIDDPNLWNALRAGTAISISAAGGTGSFIVTGITRNEPLDDVVTMNITAKSAFPG